MNIHHIFTLRREKDEYYDQEGQNNNYETNDLKRVSEPNWAFIPCFTERGVYKDIKFHDPLRVREGTVMQC